MKKILIVMMLVLLTGCNNPISSEVEKEGEKTREEMNNELIAAKEEIYQVFKSELDKTQLSTRELIGFYMKYIISTNGGYINDNI